MPDTDTLSAASTAPTAHLSRARVSVIVPAYGVAHLLEETLQSLQNQTFTQWECVIVDDGAPDDVASAAKPFLADSRFSLLETANGGVSKARNRAIASCGAPYIALLDGDDLFRPDYLARTIASLDAHPDTRLVTCNARIFGAIEEARLGVDAKQGTSDGVHGSLSDVLDRTFNVYIGTTFRREDFVTIGGFDETMSHSEDLDLWVRLMMLGGPALYLDEILGEYRVRSDSASADDQRMLRGNIRIYEKALEHLSDGPDFEVARAMLAENQTLLVFQQAIERVLDGDLSAGLSQLRQANSANSGGLAWKASMMVWRILPQLAPPMLRWRHNAHSRGSTTNWVNSLPAETPTPDSDTNTDTGLAKS